MCARFQKPRFTYNCIMAACRPVMCDLESVKQALDFFKSNNFEEPRLANTHSTDTTNDVIGSTKSQLLEAMKKNKNLPSAPQFVMKDPMKKNQ